MLTTLPSYAGIFNKNDKPYMDNGEVIFKGNFPINQNEKDNGRKDSVIANILINSEIVGTIETRNNNLKLVYCSDDKECKTIWQYTDYYYVNKITFDANKNIIRIYYDGALFREKWYVNEFFINANRFKKRLLRKGKWKL